MSYDYVRGESAQTTFTKELDKTISKLKEDKEDRQMSLLYASRMMECRHDGYQEGISIGLATGREQGREEGMEQGAYQNKLETARNLLSEELAPQMVARCTNLPLEIVEQLATQ